MQPWSAWSLPEIWPVLAHRRGAAVADGQSALDHPGFAGHLAFLRRRAEAG